MGQQFNTDCDWGNLPNIVWNTPLNISVAIIIGQNKGSRCYTTGILRCWNYRQHFVFPLTHTLLFMTFLCKFTFGIPETYYYTRPCTNPQVCYVRYHSRKSCRHFQATSDMDLVRDYLSQVYIYLLWTVMLVTRYLHYQTRRAILYAQTWCQSWYEYIQFLIRQQD